MAIEPKTTVQKTTAAKEAAVEKHTNPLRIRDTTANYVWTVVGLHDCEWTKKTMELFKEHGEQVKYIELNSEWQRRIVVDYSTRRIPAVFRGNMYMGSYDVMENYYKASFIADIERFL